MRKAWILALGLCAPTTARAQACPTGSFQSWLAAGPCTVGDVTLKLDFAQFLAAQYPSSITAVRGADFLDLTITGFTSAASTTDGQSYVVPMGSTNFQFELLAARPVTSYGITALRGSITPEPQDPALQARQIIGGSRVVAQIGPSVSFGIQGMVSAQIVLQPNYVAGTDFVGVSIENPIAVSTGIFSPFTVREVSESDFERSPTTGQFLSTTSRLTDATYRITFAPEPSAYVLMAAGLGAIALLRRRCVLNQL